MLEIKVPITPEQYDEENNLFIDPKYYLLKLEHSLISISKWEQKWHKSFLHTSNKTDEEILDYIKCMTLNPNVDPDVYNHFSFKNIQDINKYIDDPMTATTFSNNVNTKIDKSIVTSELIYYWMIEFGIPVEFQKWHINRLMTLIKICGIKKAPPQKMGKQELRNRNKALNEARRKRLNSRG